MELLLVNHLLDLAKKNTGSDAATARTLNQTAPKIGDWRAGRQPMPVADTALVAGLAGLDADQWLREAVIFEYRATAKGADLRHVLSRANALDRAGD